MDKKANLIVSGVAIFTLILAMFGGLLGFPYGFYILTRFVSCVAAVYIVYNSYKNKMDWSMWLFGALGVLYNPIFLFHLGRPVWTLVNIITIGVYIYYLWKIGSLQIVLEAITPIPNVFIVDDKATNNSRNLHEVVKYDGWQGSKEYKADYETIIRWIKEGRVRPDDVIYDPSTNSSTRAKKHDFYKELVPTSEGKSGSKNDNIDERVADTADPNTNQGATFTHFKKDKGRLKKMLIWLIVVIAMLVAVYYAQESITRHFLQKQEQAKTEQLQLVD
jgi:hypothetical protein